MWKYFSWREVAVSAAKLAAVMMMVVGGALVLALDGEPELPWVLLGCAAAVYPLSFVLVAALHGLVALQLEFSKPQPTRFGFRRDKALVVMVLISIAIGLCAGLLGQASRG
ncbi:hypothetical protein [Archangium sp.]|jgi:hypothetical protein|uniref:hypothetical protein n=1 Tax=Archangium sp. TaxID=1872627 RepID=UPI002EDA81DF